MTILFCIISFYSGAAFLAIFSTRQYERGYKDAMNLAKSIHPHNEDKEKTRRD